MKNIASILFFSALTFSCNNIKEEDNIPTSKIEIITSLDESEEDTVQTEITLKQTDTLTEKPSEKAMARTTPKPLLIARGTEPGWYAEFFADKVKLQLDYGEKTIEIPYDFSDIHKSKTYKATISEKKSGSGKSDKLTLVINIESKPCIEASGETQERTIRLILNNKTYTGCATSRVE